jgi:Fe-S-cluster containining protein
LETKKCLRSGQCCSSHFALVPKHEDSNLSPQFVEALPEDKVEDYLDSNSEMMGSPCQWLTRDEVTTEATCKAHTRKSDHCISYPEYLGGVEWCNVGVAYWVGRKQNGLPIPEWVDGVLLSLGR